MLISMTSSKSIQIGRRHSEFLIFKTMNKSILSLLALALLAGSLYYAQPDEKHSRFVEWKRRHSIQFAPFEETYRFDVFLRNLEQIERANSQNMGYKLGENQFMGITDEEFEHYYLGGIDNTYREVDLDAITGVSYPESADHSGKLNAIKNQGQCGSCWSFSAVGALEAHLIINQSTKVVLGEQQLVDCDTRSFGCDGGYANYAIDYLNKNGAVLESEYEYTAADGTCRIPKGRYKATGRRTITSVDQVYEAIAKYPVSVSVHASNWKLYQEGIFSDCINTSTNHAVVAVGYDAQGNWKIRNSWGANWGQSGHIWLAKGNTCGVLRRVDQVY